MLRGLRASGARVAPGDMARVARWRTCLLGLRASGRRVASGHVTRVAWHARLRGLRASSVRVAPAKMACVARRAGLRGIAASRRVARGEMARVARRWTSLGGIRAPGRRVASGQVTRVARHARLRVGGLTDGSLTGERLIALVGRDAPDAAPPAVVRVPVRVSLAAVVGIVVAVPERPRARGDGAIPVRAPRHCLVPAALMVAPPTIVCVGRGICAPRAIVAAAELRVLGGAILTASGRVSTARRVAVTRNGTHAACRPARARGPRVVGNAGPPFRIAAVVKARGAGAHRALTKLAAFAGIAARPAVVLVARKDHAGLRTTAVAKHLARRTHAIAALTDLTRKARRAAHATVAAVGRCVDTYRRRSAHLARRHGSARDALARDARRSAGARRTARAAVSVIAHRVGTNRRVCAPAHLQARRAHAGAVLTVCAGRARAAACAAVGVVIRQRGARRVDAGPAQHPGSRAHTLARVAGRVGRTLVAACAAIGQVGHEVSATRIGARTAECLIARASALAASADMSGRAFVVTAATVFEIFG